MRWSILFAFFVGVFFIFAVDHLLVKNWGEVAFNTFVAGVCLGRTFIEIRIEERDKLDRIACLETENICLRAALHSTSSEENSALNLDEAIEVPAHAKSSKSDQLSGE